MNIAFMGSPKIAEEILEVIHKREGENLKLVITKEDKVRKRGKKTSSTPVKEFAKLNKIDVKTPLKIDKEFIEEFKKYNIDLAIVVAYGKIFPKEFLEIPKNGCINIHFSILPKYRGASPVESAILNGEKKTGVSIIYLTEGVDEGNIILKEEFEILEEEGTKEVFKKALEVSKVKIIDVIDKIKSGTIKSYKQQGESSYCTKFTKEMTILDFNKDAKTLNNIVRAFNMDYGAKTDLFGFNVKIWKTKIIKAEKEYKDFVPGTILIKEKQLFVKTKDDFLQILEIQPESKKRLNYKDFLNGYLDKINKKDVKIIKK